MLVAAVADGAGSAELSADGSRIAACAATRSAARLLRLHTHPVYEGVLEEILRESVRSVRKELEAESLSAEETSPRLRHYPDSRNMRARNHRRGADRRRRDGNRRAVRAEGYTLFSAPQRGEYANTTNFITSSGWQNTLDVSTRRGGVSRLAMFTDGIQSIALNAASDNTPHAPVLRPALSLGRRAGRYRTGCRRYILAAFPVLAESNGARGRRPDPAARGSGVMSGAVGKTARMVNQGDISVWSSATNQITLRQSDVLGSGGEGAVYSLQSHPDLVAKIYHSNRRTDAVISKLDVMINYPPRTEDDLTGHLFVAWPRHLVYDTARDVIGFLMPKVEKTSSLFEYYNPALRRRNAPQIHYANLCSVAKSLATALDRLHGSGYVVGDINESNAYITENEHVTLIDADSFQITDYQTTPPTIYRCLVGKPEYTPPELQGISFDQVDRNIHHDRFALAVVIYQLLMEGTHPFRGIYTGAGEKPQVESCISRGYFLHSAEQECSLEARSECRGVGYAAR